MLPPSNPPDSIEKTAFLTRKNHAMLVHLFCLCNWLTLDDVVVLTLQFGTKINDKANYCLFKFMSLKRAKQDMEAAWGL